MGSGKILSEKVKNLLKNDALQNTIIVTAGSFIGSIFSYLVQIFLARNLSVAEYGIFNTLLSVSITVGVLNTTFITSTVKAVSNLKSKNRFDVLTRLFVNISVVSLGVGLLIGFLIFIFSGNLASFLNIKQVGVIIAFAVYMIVPFLRVAPFSYLQGLLKFKSFAFISVFYNLMRLVGSVTAIYLGYRIGGVYIAIAVGVVIAYFVGTFLLKDSFVDFHSGDMNGHYRKILIFAGPVLFVQICMILLNNIDIILVKHFFDEHSAGLYSGLVTVGKVFLFGANTVVIAMFPQISHSFSKGEDYVKKFKQFFLLQLLVIFTGLAVFWIMPGFIVDVMFGEAYLPVVKYLPKFVVFFGIYVLLNFMTLFLLAIEKTKVFLLQIPAIVMQVILIYKSHDTLDQVINMNLISSALLLLLVVFYVSRSLKKPFYRLH